MSSLFVEKYGSDLIKILFSLKIVSYATEVP